MIYIDRNRIPIPQIYVSREMEIAQKRLGEFYNRTESSRSQERYLRPFEPQLTKEVISSLRSLFRNKCAYCESPLPPASTGGDIENFRPKSNARGLEKDFSKEHYWWLTYEWGNLYYACQKCNRYKSSWFPVEGKRAKALTPFEKIHTKEFALLLDPCLDRPEKHLIFDDQGNVDFLTTKGKTTIEILKLNRADLIDARKETVQSLFETCEDMLSLWNTKKKDKNRIKSIAIKWEDLFSNSSDEPYIAIQRQILSKWLSNRHELQNYLSKKGYNSQEAIAVEMEAVGVPEILEEAKKFVIEGLTKEERDLVEEAVNFDDLKHVYIEKIELGNFKCFTNLIINFSNEAIGGNSDAEPWLLFLGENGVGKSSILKAITIALCGENYFEKLGLTASNLLQRNKENGFINLFLKGEENPIEIKFDGNKITSSIKEPKANLIAYGSVRLLPKARKLLPEKFKPGGIKAQNLFDYSISLTDGDKWLLDRTEDDFQRAALTLKDLMMLGSDVLIKRDFKDGKIFVQRDESKLNIDELSDGYQSVYALAVDIMSSFVIDKITYDIAEGIVLIDEIGTHLHPRWKMEVVSQLRRTFPRMQFIVTTHEPLCLRGLKAGEAVVLLTNIDKEVIALTDLPDPSELRIDQILTSDFFGLKSTFDPQTEKLFEEYYAILALDSEDRTEEQKNRIIELSEVIPKIKHLGDNLREELVYYVVDELLARKTREEGLKIKKDLKQEALLRVQSLWKLIAIENDNR